MSPQLHRLQTLFDRNSVRAHGPGRERAIEVEVEVGIENQIILGHLGDMNIVVAFGVDLAEVVFVEEVIANNQTLFVFSEREIMRPRTLAQIERL